MDTWICVIIVCVGGIWDCLHVTADTSDVVDILHGIRRELNNLKLSNDRNERKIMRLERQVGEYHTKYGELTKHTLPVAGIEQRLADVEHKVEVNHEELLKLLEAVEISRTTDISDIKHIITDNIATVDDDVVKMNLDASKMDIDADKMDLDTEKMNNEDQIGSELTTAKERSKRIIPVTSAPATNTKVAFSAHISHAASQIRWHNVVPFDSVVTNEGLAFSPTTHIFTCPIRGMYFFTSAISSSADNFVQTSIMINGEMVINLGGERDAKQGYNSVVIACNKGDLIWVYIFGNVHSVRDAKFTASFTGFLLWEL